MTVTYYCSSVSSNLQMKKAQQQIEMILDSKKIQYEKIDIATSEDMKKKMREMSGDPKALPPQLFNNSTYCGGYTEFMEAVEDENLNGFLKL
ncbi:SH3 domain-binding glutamic acid-rich-like protein 3 [Trichoplax sp. H2]|nr:SH3 domain-binding glutamic acid-rich-like protein 3 [Trichoplax sp. H2]|eukprot:RDD39194.1 SH3 domain-binding glutamic acid-rich-like protein 3 [Trichoplax sp. H2]